MTIEKELEIGGQRLTIKTGHVARQAHGSAWLQYGETVVLTAAVISDNLIENPSFVPFMIDYREKAYAAGKIPGGFFKREGRPTEKEILSARLIDRPLRPLLPKNLAYETQVICFVLSADQENDSDVLCLIGASLAMSISEIPFDGPVAAVRIGKIDGKLVTNPTFTMLKDSTMDLVVAGTEDSITMVEGEAKEISEAELVEALRHAHEDIKKLIPVQKEIAELLGVKKRVLEEHVIPESLVEAASSAGREKLLAAIQIQDKKERRQKIKDVNEEVVAALIEEFPEEESSIKKILSDVEIEEVRRMALDKGMRLDGRGLDDIRSITCEVGLLPRAHGSAIFTRGQTQSLAATTLGTKMDEQKIENLVIGGQYWKSYTLHYNFPPFCVGEARMPRGPSRREIGHGNLAERALKPVIPAQEDFPYTIRIVSDILESNGSSSMATVCAGSLSLMDAGVPIKRPVGGIAMGLIKEGDKMVVLSDILGDEDHLGDMDFKVAGTREGISSVQMDIKISGVSSEIMEKALEKARINRIKVLDIMDQTLSVPRESTSKYAPKIITFKIAVEDIGMVIGPGGKIIREIQQIFECDINLDDDGTIFISAQDMQKGTEAKTYIQSMLAGPEVGQIYKGKVKKITNFGAFVEILPGKDGLLHISEIEHHRVNRVEDVLKLGDEVEVKVKRVDEDGKVDLSRKALLKRDEK